MKRFICSFIFSILIGQLVVGPAVAQNYSGQFGRPLEGNNASGMSFRQKSAQDLRMPGGNDLLGADALKAKGMMMTESSLAGLTYQVHVLGEVKSPGTYRITASDRLSEVLMRSGGVDEQGSQRKIEVRRKGEAIKTVDLLAFQVFGDLSNNPYLLDNDVIYVPLRKSMIQVVGAVMRPLNYELKNESNLAEAIDLAGGFSVGVAKKDPIRVVRFSDGSKHVLEVAQTYTELREFKIQNGDVVFIPNIITENNTFDYNPPKLPGDNIFYPSFEDRVFVLGGVGAAGAYLFNPYYNLSQYLSLAGGTTKMATRRIDILSFDGKRKRIRKKNMDTVVINPGDTIVVGERRIPPEGWISLVTGLVASVLGITTTILYLKDR